MTLSIRCLFVATVFFSLAARATVPEPTEPIAADAPFWRGLASRVAEQGDVTVNFSEQRWFPFRKEPLLLTGEARVSPQRGLSLHYRTPEQRTVIVDRAGLLIRDAGGEAMSPPADPRANAINAAMLHILQLDLVALQTDFDVLGSHAGDEWSIALTPKAPEIRRAIGRISVAGVRAAVARLELRHSAKQRVEIDMSQPLTGHAFTAEELKRYFR